MYLSLRFKLFIPLLLLALLGAILIFTLWLPHNHKLLTQDHHNILNEQLENIGQTIGGMLVSNNFGSLYSALDSLLFSNQNWLDLKVYNKKNQLIYPLTDSTHEVNDVIHKIRHSIIYKNIHLGTIEVVADFSDRHKELNKQENQLLFILLGGVFLSVFIASLTVEVFIRRPILKISKAAENLANGNYNTELPGGYNDEIGGLSHRFISMKNSILQHQSEIINEYEAKQKAQNEIDLKNKQIANILENTPDAYLSIDHSQNIIFVNDRAKSLLKLDGLVFFGENLWDTLPELASYLYKDVQNVLLNKKSCQLEVYYPPSALWLDAHIFNCSDGVSIYLSDISQRKKIEQKLRKSERRQRAIFENIVDGIISTDKQGIILSFNPAASSIFGFSEKEAVGSPISILLHSDDAHTNDAFINDYHQFTISSFPSGIHRELEGKHKDGAVFPIEITITEMQVSDELQFVAIIRDVTEQKKSADQLRLSERIFKSNNEGIVITDSNTRILRVNEAFLRITNYSENEVVGEKINILSSGLQDNKFYSEMWKSILQQGHWQGEILNRRKSGEIYPEWLSISSIYDINKEVVNYVGIFSDITDKKRIEERIYHMAHYDELTGLLNRSSFNIELVNAIEEANNNSTSFVILYLDLDHFKKINDTLGHPVGDKLLQIIAGRLKDMLRSADIVCRIGGDEFVVLLTDVNHPEYASNIAKNIIEKLSHPIELERRELFIGSSIGIAVYPQDANNADDLVRNADAALFRAKKYGRNNYQFYLKEMNAKASEHLELESQLHHALDLDEFVLYYQPQIDLEQHKVIGVEALIRWVHPELGVMSPGEFIPLLEETGMIIPVGEWVLYHACLQAKSWLESGVGEIRIAVNISPHQFLYSDIVNSVKDVLNTTGLPPYLLELEITEGSIMTDVEENIRHLQQLSDMGIKLSIDDFGTGYSSLAYLKRLPIDTLKIDRSFVRNMHSDKDDENIVTAIISLGKNLNIRVIAEGVEDTRHLKKLKWLDCDEVQGYFISRPLSEKDLIIFLKKQEYFYKRVVNLIFS